MGDPRPRHGDHDRRDDRRGEKHGKATRRHPAAVQERRVRGIGRGAPGGAPTEGGGRVLASCGGIPFPTSMRYV
jgi:hypothetical protein